MRFKKIGWCLALLSRLCCFCLFLVPGFAVFGVKDVFFCQMETSKKTLNISKAGKKQREDVKFVWKHWQLLFWGVCCRKLSSVFAVAPKCPRVNTQKIEANDCSVALLSILKIPKIAIEALKAAPNHVAPWRRCGKHCLRTGSGWGRVV